MVLSKEHRQLLRELSREHASNAIVKRQVRRGVDRLKNRFNRYEKSGALGRDIRRGSDFARSLIGSGAYRVAASRGKRHYGRDIKEYGSMGRHHRYGSGRGARKLMEKGQMTICHSEYIGDLISAVATNTFISQSYPIQCASIGTFPWLASIAVNFQGYRFKKLIFEYRPLTSAATSTTSGALVGMGAVVMATQYDSPLGAYPNKAQMENSDFSVSIKPDEHADMAVECKPGLNPLGMLYTSANSSLTTTTNGTDIRMQNLGIFQIAAVNIPTNGSNAISLGEIWVHYEIELYKPQLNAYLSAVPSSHIQITSPATGSSMGASAASFVAVPGSNLGLIWASATTFSFPLSITEGSFLIVYSATSSATAAVNIGMPSVVAPNALLTVWAPAASGFDTLAYILAPQASLAADNTSVLAFVVSVNAPGSTLCTVTIPATLLPTGTNRADMFVTLISTNIVT